MKTEDGYRFSLSFLANTPEQEQVGEFLEALGSKKSRLIVQVLSEYLQGLSETPPEPAELVRAAYDRKKPAVPKRKPQRQTTIRASEEALPVETPTEQEQDPGEDSLTAMLASMSFFG